MRCTRTSGQQIPRESGSSHSSLELLTTLGNSLVNLDILWKKAITRFVHLCFFPSSRIFQRNANRTSTLFLKRQQKDVWPRELPTESGYSSRFISLLIKSIGPYSTPRMFETMHYSAALPQRNLAPKLPSKVRVGKVRMSKATYLMKDQIHRE